MARLVRAFFVLSQWFAPSVAEAARRFVTVPSQSQIFLFYFNALREVPDSLSLKLTGFPGQAVNALNLISKTSSRVQKSPKPRKGNESNRLLKAP